MMRRHSSRRTGLQVRRNQQNHCRHSVQAVWAEQDHLSTVKDKEPAAWAAYQDLLDRGLLTVESQRKSMRMSEKARPARLAVSQDDVKRGLEQSKNAPSALHAALRGMAGTQLIDASSF